MAYQKAKGYKKFNSPYTSIIVLFFSHYRLS